ncbi:unnamed protein product [Leuciscus chuanchicus]
MSSSGEDDCDVNTGEEGDGPSDSPGREDVVTLILTPVDLPSKPSYTFQPPPIKKRIFEKSKNTADWEQPTSFATFREDLPSSRSLIILSFVSTDIARVGGMSYVNHLGSTHH